MSKRKKEVKKTKEWYSFTPMVEKHPEATYYMAFSEKGNGKTTDLLTRCLKNYKEKRWQGALIRRRERSFVGQSGDTLFGDLVQRGVVRDIFDGEWTGIYHAGTRWYLCREVEVTKKDGNTETKREINRDPILFGFYMEGGAQEDYNGGHYTRVHEIYFDEFMTRTGYLTDEFTTFNIMCSMIIREKTDVKIFMAGNTLSKVACPYFREMGLTRVKKMEQGTIDVYTYGEAKLQVAVEYCKNREKSKDNEKYFAFGNPRLKMITEGVWMVAVHPHLPPEYKYRERDIVFTFFIDFDGELMRGDIISKGASLFLYITPKTTPLQSPDTDLIYSDKYDARPNWRRSIFRDTLPVTAKLRPFIINGKTYFADNMTGEFFDGFVKWSKSNI